MNLCASGVVQQAFSGQRAAASECTSTRAPSGVAQTNARVAFMVHSHHGHSLVQRYHFCATLQMCVFGYMWKEASERASGARKQCRDVFVEAAARSLSSQPDIRLQGKVY